MAVLLPVYTQRLTAHLEFDTPEDNRTVLHAIFEMTLSTEQSFRTRQKEMWNPTILNESFYAV